MHSAYCYIEFNCIPINSIRQNWLAIQNRIFNFTVEMVAIQSWTMVEKYSKRKHVLMREK